MLRSDRTLICNGCCDALRGTGPRATGTEAFFFVGRSIEIKVLTDLFCLFRLRSIDIKVFQTFFSLILKHPENPANPASEYFLIFNLTKSEK